MKRAVIIILFIISALSLAALNRVHAADTWKQQDRLDWYNAATQGEDNNAQATWFTGLQNMEYGISFQTTGQPSPIADSRKNFQKSAIGFISNTVALTFTTPPADLGVWLADTGQSLGFIPKQAYAQGVGFSGLLPLLPIWKVFRNVAYLLMAAVMVVIGFMIMFRKKIDPKTVVTAQNAISRVVIALILITFSYAIVGLVIDIMYVVIALIAALFQTAGLSNAQTNIASSHLTTTVWDALKNFNPMKILFGWPGDPMVSLAESTFIAAVGLAIGFSGNPVGFIGALAGLLPIIYLIYAVALLFLWVKLLAFFVSAYIQIILALLIAPLQLLAEGFPGSTAFSSWFKNLIANVAVFPVAAAMFMLSSLFQQFANASSPQAIWAPPYAVFSTGALAVASIVSIGLLFAIVPVCSSIKEALKAKSAVPMFNMGGAGGSAMQMLSAAYYIKAIDPGGVVSRLMGKKPGPEQG